MSRLSLEWQRLYAVVPAAGEAAAPGRVRAAVLELARPADWAALSAVWQGVQADLGLPAPGIAVNGRDGYQLWFSLRQPVPAAQALAFVQALGARYLGDTLPGRLSLWPGAGDRLAPAMVPAVVGDGGPWSAFVAPDLAPVFTDEPWLDTPPNEQGQAELLARLGSASADAFERAVQRLPGAAAPVAAAAPAAPAAPAASTAPATAAHRDPQRFLLEVMNDDRVDLALRIEAAKALLAYGPRSGPAG
ncbi:MAG: hypothetical protein RJA10_801 [Pseudomonadota bacterium]